MSKTFNNLYYSLNSFICSFGETDIVVTELKEKIVAWLIKYYRADESGEVINELDDLIRLYISDSERAMIKEFSQNIKISDEEDFDTYENVVSSYIISPIVMKEGDEATPDSLDSLLIELLKINKNDDIADLFAGQGGFLDGYFDFEDDTVYHSYEINPLYWASNIFSERDREIAECLNAFELADTGTIKQYTKILANFPFNVKFSSSSYEFKVAKKIAKEMGMPEPWNGISSDWLFNLLVMRLLKKGGRAVSIMTYGAAINKQDERMRKAFVDKGYINAVITLPERIFSTTNIKTAIVLFSYGNTGVKLVDASNMCVSERRNRVLDDDTYDQIYNALNVEGEYGTTVTFEQMATNDYSFYQGRYLDTSSCIDMVAIGDVCKRITRGVGIKADELDELYSNDKTAYRFLMMNDIINGEFNVNGLRNLKEVVERYRKYCVHNHDLILAKNTYPFKVAVAEIDDTLTVLANSNLYILELDNERINPLYLKMYLESDEGQSRLKNLSTGSIAASIGISDLKKFKVPNPSLKWQERMVARYQKKLEEIHELESQLVENRLSLSNIIKEQLLDR